MKENFTNRLMDRIQQNNSWRLNSFCYYISKKILNEIDWVKEEVKEIAIAEILLTSDEDIKHLILEFFEFSMFGRTMRREVFELIIETIDKLNQGGSK